MKKGRSSRLRKEETAQGMSQEGRILIRRRHQDEWISFNSYSFVMRARPKGFSVVTMVENGKKHRQNSHLIIHFPTSEGVSEVSKRVNE